ncbi:type IV-A pilus assembly ATPase PilB [Francisellaceae bacterium]|nr:type IV-A pilus assembly ATPase PilB [Francisellaceae bacterium]
MVNNKIQLPLDGISAFIVKQKLAKEEDVRTAIDIATRDHTKSVVGTLTSRRLMNEESYLRRTSEFFGLRMLDITAFKLDDLAKDYFHEDSMRKHAVLPVFKRDKLLTIAVSNPLNVNAFKDIQFRYNVDIELILASDTQLRTVIDSALKKLTSRAMEEFGADNLDDINLDLVAEGESVKDEDPNIDDAPIVSFINKVILDAIQSDASDIHFEPFEHRYRVRFRIDGSLSEIASPPVALTPKITSRLKIMSKIDIAERRVPQDGRFKMKISAQSTVDFRVSTCPTLYGEKVVLRILDPSSTKMGIDKLGYDPIQKKLYLQALNQKQGMILVTGPTGSGKTVSLYTGLELLNVEESNISTAEDPVEINLPGVNQVDINPKTGLTFARALKSFLRQDPDIIMVGEIRDLETAEIAVKAAQTGHLVLSTLHTNSAPETLSRLLSMGVASYNVASSIILIIAQRLMKRICPSCKKEIEVPKESLKELGFTDEQIAEDFTVYQAVGCEKCNNGYRGRIGIYEVMPITKSMRKIIMKSGNAMEIADQAQEESINNLRQSALIKVMQGITTLEELNVTVKDND